MRCRQIVLWTHGVARLTRPPVTGKIRGSNPLGSASEYTAHQETITCRTREIEFEIAMRKIDADLFLYAAWSVSLIAVLGSLYFSDIRAFAPCVLCWYQRIAMYPLVPILAVGIARQDRAVHWYVLPLSILGLLVSLYHNFLYYGLLPEAISPCVAGVPCTTRFVAYFGFVGIPLLSLAAFALITVAMIWYKKAYEAV